MKLIPPQLQGELAIDLHMDTLRQVDLFSECEKNLLYEFVFCFKLYMFGPNDFLCQCGDVAKVFLIK